MNTKFDLGQTIFYISKQREVAPCGMCGGEGKLALVKGGELECPVCHGVGHVPTANFINGDIISFEPNIIQVQTNGTFYAQVAEGGNTLHALDENEVFGSEDEAIAFLKSQIV